MLQKGAGRNRPAQEVRVVHRRILARLGLQRLPSCSYASWNHREGGSHCLAPTRFTPQDCRSPDLNSTSSSSSRLWTGWVLAGRVSYEKVEILRRAFADRRAEFREFLEHGGVAVVLLIYPSYLLAECVVDPVSSYQLVLDSIRDESTMQLVAETGSSWPLLDSESPLAAYVEGLKRWECTLEQGVVADDPHGYRLAENRHNRGIAFVEHSSIHSAEVCGLVQSWTVVKN